MLLQGIVNNTSQDVFILSFLVFLGISFWLGSHTEQQYRQEQKLKSVENRNIAVTKFCSTALEDAQRGIQTGTYGVYVVI